jgi:hypothetical protein
LVPLLQVFDMNAAIAFYCDVLGFEKVTLPILPPLPTPRGERDGVRGGAARISPAGLAERGQEDFQCPA